MNDDYYPNSNLVRHALESAIINSNENVSLSEIIDLSDIEAFIQTDKNIRRDYGIDNVENDRKLKNVDFLIRPRLSKLSFNQFYSLQIDVISLRDGNFLDKSLMPTIELKELEITRSLILEKIFSEALKDYAFTIQYGFIHKSKLEQIEIDIEERDNLIDSLRFKLSKIENYNAKLEAVKRSIPDYTAELILIDSMLHVAFKFNNEVPINVRVYNSSSTYNLDKSNELPLFGHLPMEDYDLFPPIKGRGDFSTFKYDSFGDRDREYLKQLGKIRVVMDLKVVSLYAAEMQLPELAPVNLQLDFVLDWDAQTMTRYEEK